MKIFILTEVRVYKVNGHFYANQSFAKIIERYNRSFGEVILATRIIEENKKRNGYIKIDDFCSEFDNIRSIPVFLLKKIPSNIKNHIKNSDLVVLRLHSIVCIKIIHLLSKFSKKYMVEVVGCAWDAYWNHSIVGKIVAPYMFFKIKKIVKNADYAIYVTQEFLQKRYPCKNKTIGVSDADILLTELPKKYNNFDKKNITMMTAAALNVKFKGQAYVIKAIRKLKNKYDINIIYYLAGKGDDSRLRKMIKKYGLEKNVVFLGMLSREEMFKYMQKIDFYIQPSLQEGLPRALLEAMSLGNVCFGSDTGGIPELLDKSQIFKRKNVQVIVDVILDTINSDNLSTISSRNAEKASEYVSSALEKKRTDFFRMVKGDILSQYDFEKKQSKITFVINKLIGGGSERVTCNLANYFCRNGYNVDVVTMSDEGGSYKLDNGVRVITVLDKNNSMNKLSKLFKKQNGLRQYVMVNQDVSCYVVMMPLNAFMMARLRKYINGKMIISERNNPSSYIFRERVMMKYAVRKCDGLVVQTKEISRWYKSVKNKIAIPNAINEDVTLPERGKIKNKIVAVGRLEKQKNYPMMIKAFSIFNKKYPEYILEIYGQGSQEEKIRALIAKYGLVDKIRLMGYVKDVSTCIADAACFVMTSKYEGMPNALIEAMCMGVPCVVTNCSGGSAEELIVNMENGILVEKNAVDDFSSSIGKIVDNKKMAEKISNNAMELKTKLRPSKIYNKWLIFVGEVGGLK